MNDFVTEFIHSIISDVEVIFEGDDFWAKIEKRVINIGINPDEIGYELIHRFVLDKFGVDMDPFLIGCLHEIGHIETYDVELYEDSYWQHFLLELNYEEDRYEEFCFMYFNVPSEYKATEWAVNYYLANKEKCDKFMDMIR